MFGSKENDDVFSFCVCSHGDESCNLMLTNMVGTLNPSGLTDKHGGQVGIME